MASTADFGSAYHGSIPCFPTMEQQLTAEKVQRIFLDSLFKEEEIVDGKPYLDPIITEGVVNKIGFHPERIKQHRNEIVMMLADLPDDFQSTGGKGQSFLYACETKQGVQWTSLHRTMDELVCLGLAVDAVEFCLPKTMWDILPGGMPYFRVK